MSDNTETFEQFWAHFLKSHTKKVNRVVHTAGISLSMAVSAYALARRKWWLMLGSPLIVVPFALTGHVLEGNRPENTGSTGSLVRSIWANLRMWKRTLDGSLDAEVEQLMRRQNEDAPTPP